MKISIGKIIRPKKEDRDFPDSTAEIISKINDKYQVLVDGNFSTLITKEEIEEQFEEINDIENPGFKKWNDIDICERFDFKRSIQLGNYATYQNTLGSYIEGRVEMINNYGLDISVEGKYKFIRWDKIKSIRKV